MHLHRPLGSADLVVHNVLLRFIPRRVVFLRGRNAGVPQKFRDLADIDTCFEKLDGGRVAETMRMAVCDFSLDEYFL
jgi:hypothetical protein